MSATSKLRKSARRHSGFHDGPTAIEEAENFDLRCNCRRDDSDIRAAENDAGSRSEKIHALNCLFYEGLRKRHKSYSDSDKCDASNDEAAFIIRKVGLSGREPFAQTLQMPNGHLVDILKSGRSDDFTLIAGGYQVVCVAVRINGKLHVATVDCDVDGDRVDESFFLRMLPFGLV